MILGVFSEEISNLIVSTFRCTLRDISLSLSLDISTRVECNNLTTTQLQWDTDREGGEGGGGRGGGEGEEGTRIYRWMGGNDERLKEKKERLYCEEKNGMREAKLVLRDEKGKRMKREKEKGRGGRGRGEGITHSIHWDENIEVDEWTRLMEVDKNEGRGGETSLPPSPLLISECIDRSCQSQMSRKKRKELFIK